MARTLVVRRVEADNARIDTAVGHRAVGKLALDFALKNQLGARQAALAKLKQRFSAASFRWASTAKPPLAVWSYLRHRNAENWAADDAPLRDKQEVIAVFYLIAGRLPTGSALVGGNWGLDFSWHCIARLVSPERSPLAAGPIETMSAAHQALLRSSARALASAKDGFLLPMGADGSFLCAALPAELAGGDRVVFVTAHTWLAPHMASSYPRLPPAECRDDTLGLGALCPVPLRRRRPDGVDVPAVLAAALRPAPPS
jgi:hypothetical protein